MVLAAGGSTEVGVANFKMATPSEAQSTTTSNSSKLSRMFDKAMASDITIKSQQRGDPELSNEAKADVLSQLLQNSPGTFLRRFGSLFDEEDLQYFVDSDHYEVQHYLKEFQKLLVGKKKQNCISNRRYKAIEDLTMTTSYFSEDEMRERCPLLYEQYIGRFMTEEEKESMERCKHKGELSLSAHVSNKMDNDAIYHKLCQELKTERNEDSETVFGEDVSVLTLSNETEAAEKDKLMLRKEFLRLMHLRFINGEDEYNYSHVDNNEEYDVSEVYRQDCEDSYFDSEEPSRMEQHDTTNYYNNDSIDDY